ncbi:unnamed protein product [Ectocarpus fasciculatus]
MEWFTDGVADHDANSTESRGTPAEQAGRRLGKRHLKTLLAAVGRGCLEGTNTAEEKAEKLLQVFVGKSGVRATKPSGAPEKSLVESPAVSAPSHDGRLGREAEFAALKAKLEAMELADERRQAKLEDIEVADARRQQKLEALELADNKRQAELEALELADERRQAEIEALLSDNKTLLGEVGTMKKLIPKPRGGESSCVDAGEKGHLFLPHGHHRNKSTCTEQSGTFPRPLWRRVGSLRLVDMLQTMCGIFMHYSVHRGDQDAFFVHTILDVTARLCANFPNCCHSLCLPFRHLPK